MRPSCPVPSRGIGSSLSIVANWHLLESARELMLGPTVRGLQASLRASTAPTRCTHELGVARAGWDALIAIGYWGRGAPSVPRPCPIGTRRRLSKGHAALGAVIAAGLGTHLSGSVNAL